MIGLVSHGVPFGDLRHTGAPTRAEERRREGAFRAQGEAEAIARKALGLVSQGARQMSTSLPEMPVSPLQAKPRPKPAQSALTLQVVAHTPLWWLMQADPLGQSASRGQATVHMPPGKRLSSFRHRLAQSVSALHAAPTVPLFGPAVISPHDSRAAHTDNKAACRTSRSIMLYGARRRAAG